MVETITKRERTIKITEYIVKCNDCNKSIIGSTEYQVAFNLKAHKGSKRCKDDK